MSNYRIRAGDVGTTIQFAVKENGLPVDISSASAKLLVFYGPPNSGIPTRPLPASFVTNGMDGLLQYTTVSGDIPGTKAAVGLWEVQASLTIAPWSGNSDIDTFAVDPMLT